MKNMISLDGGRTWKTAEEAMEEISRRNIWNAVYNRMVEVDSDLVWRVRYACMDESIDSMIVEFLRKAEDGLCISEPVYGRNEFAAKIEEYFKSNHYKDWAVGNIRVSKQIKYDAESRTWVTRCRFMGDGHWYPVVGYEDGMVRLNP